MKSAWPILAIYLAVIPGLARASITFTAGFGYGSGTSTGLKEYDVYPSGTSQRFSLGLRERKTEVGAYTYSNTFQGSIKHDDETNTLNSNSNSVGAYFAYYFRKSYLEIGYGKVTNENELDSPLSEAQQEVLKEMYEIEDESNSDEVRFLAGTKLYRISNNAYITGYAQYVKQFTGGYQEGQVGLEFKLSLR